MQHRSVRPPWPALEPDPTDFHIMPGYLIRRAHQAATALFTAECGQFDLTPVQFAAMSAIRDAPNLDATRLAASIAFDRSTLGDVLERLEAKGWVVRLPSATDRRVKKLGLSKAGAALLKRVQPAVQRVQERLLAPFPPEERAAVLAIMRRLGSADEQAPSSGEAEAIGAAS